MGLTHLTIEILNHRELFEKNFSEIYSITKRELATKLENETIHDRIFGNWVIPLATFRTLETVIKGLNINYANLAGDVNSTKVDVKGLQTTVGTANGDIAQLKLDAQNLQTMLAGKVDNTTYTNFVNLTNQALNARLTASDLNGYAKTADVQATANGLQVNINSVNGKLDNLVIGGRNLVRNSGFPKNADYWNGVERATHDFYYTKKQPLFLIKANTTEERLGSSTYFPLKRNTDYVVSFKGFASVNVSSYDIFILARKYGETNSYSSIKHLVDAKRLSGSSVQYVKDLVFNSGENDEAYFRIDNNGSSDGKDAWLFFTEVKVEEGNKSTAWTPAPSSERNTGMMASAGSVTSGLRAVKRESFHILISPAKISAITSPESLSSFTPSRL